MRDCYYERDTGIDDFKGRDSGNKSEAKKSCTKVDILI